MKHLSNVFLISVSGVIASHAHSDWQLNLTDSATAVGREIHTLHMTIFWICVVIAVLVFGIILWSVVLHRKSLGAEAKPFHESTTIELIWTAIPLLILVAMAVPATATLIRMYDTSVSDIDIKVTGYQWKWQYEYLNEGIGFFSVLTTSNAAMHNDAPKSPEYLLEVDKPLVIPVNKKVRFLFTANDVIHSWWVPELAVKKDAVPGFINEAWTNVDTPGIYRGQCAELCGQGHGYMPVVVHAVSQEEYDVWLSQQQNKQNAAGKAEDLSHEELMEQGKAGYEKHCAACHQINGSGLPPVFPALTNSPVVLGDVNDHIDIILNGRNGTAMAAFGAQLTPTEVAAITTYERNAWENNTGDTVQPSDVIQLQSEQNGGN